MNLPLKCGTTPFHHTRLL